VSNGWSVPVLGAVLCGGRSRRFGSDKALAPFGSSTVGGRVVAALRGAGIDPVIAVGGQAGNHLGLPTIADRRPGEGPLGGLATALLYARHGWVLVVPCDLPLLRADDVARLLAPGPDGGAPIVATVDGTPRFSLSLWPAAHGRRILRLVDSGERRFGAAIAGIPWTGAEVPDEALADADTPEELTRLQRDGR
jgi:molybdenum cofactor guanylyltransferase